VTCRWHQLQKAVKASNLPAADKAVFLARLDHATFGTADMPAEWTRPQKKVARETSLSLRQVKYSEQHLARHGWLSTKRAAEGDRRKLRYVLAAGTECDCIGRRHAPQRVQRNGRMSATRAPRKVQRIGATPQVDGRFDGRGTDEGKEKRPPEPEPETHTEQKYRSEPPRSDGYWHAAMNALYEAERP
jgi:hypothetical protein